MILPAVKGGRLSKIEDKVALISGGDNGIGRAVGVAFPKEGAALAIAYLDEHGAAATRWLVEKAGQRCVLLPVNLGTELACESVVVGQRECAGPSAGRPRNPGHWRGPGPHLGPR